MKLWIWIALLWMGITAPWSTAHAAETERPLSLMLLPPIAGKGSPQLAISWKGEQDGQLELTVVDAGGERRRLKTRSLEPGMHLDSVELASTDQKLLAVLMDTQGRELARAESAAQPEAPRLEAVTEPAETPRIEVVKAAPQPKGGTLDWKATFTGNDGPNGTVSAMTIYDDGTGPALVIGGQFTTAGGVSANRIARWNGSAWSALGTGMDSQVNALTVYNGELIAGGGFGTAGGVSANRIARWNGSAWSALGTGMNSAVHALTVRNGDLLAGGNFTTAGGVTVNRIARWNGSAWSALGTGMNDTVWTLTIYNGDLIAGGNFTTAGGVSANRMARWNGSAWSALGTGMNDTVFALTVYNGEVIAGGFFTTAGGVSANRIARWNGSAWSALGTGMDSQVNALTVYNGELIAGGGFGTAGGVVVDFIARWNGSAWSALGTGMNSSVHALTVYNGELIAGGFFTSAGGLAANRIARWNGSTWSAMGRGLNDFVTSFAVYGGELIVGGQFTSAGGVTANRIARWNGSAWSALETGMNGSVLALTVYGGELIAGGLFTTAGGVTVNRIARWNGSAWSTLSSGVNGIVNVLTVYGGELIAGGTLTTAGGLTVNNIARWNGSAWSALGTGVDSTVLALTVYNNDLVAGGSFSTAGGISANRIASWNGSGWSALGSGVNPNTVSALTVYGGELIAGGDFFNAGGAVANRIARWNGNTWSPMGSGIGGSVRALTVYDSKLIAGGDFTTAGGVSANRIARWNGSSWSALGSGMNNGVRAITVYSGELVAGGFFGYAGSGASPSIAAYGVADLTVTEITSTHPSSSRAGEPVRIRARVVASTAPTAGHLTITGSPGGSCSDLTLTPVDATTSEAECTIRWSTAGARTLTAIYIGGTNGNDAWQPSTSATFTHTVGAATDDWRPSFVDAETGLNGVVNAATVWDDGSGPALYVGGDFTHAGNTLLNRVAKWNGDRWVPLGSGMDGLVLDLSVYNGQLTAGGFFGNAGGVANTSRIARWDGTGWSAFGSGMNAEVSALTVFNGDLIAGGGFTTAGGTPANRIARWNGSGWSGLGSGTDNPVRAVHVHGGALIVGGLFGSAGGVSGTSRIARWNGSSWSALGSGMNGEVRKLASYNSDLIAGGYFTTAGGTSASRIARWNGSTWSALGSGMNNEVQALAVYNGELIAGGAFTTAGGNSTNRIARWNGSLWSSVGSSGGNGVNDQVYALSVLNGELYAGGTFTYANIGGTVQVPTRLARWNGNAWSPLGAGIDSVVIALAVYDGALIAGGVFSTIGGVTVNNVARWNGTSWSALGSGISNQVNALAVYGGELIAAGVMTSAGGVAVNNIARWNGSSWSALGLGVNSTVQALTVHDGALIAGGNFTTAGGGAANRIARWNGSAWSALGSGMDNWVRSLAVYNGVLFAGGDFTTASGVTANRIARWNGNAWVALGSGMNSGGIVWALAVYDGALIAGGGFGTAGGVAVSNIARWNGSSWSALGTGISSQIRALTIYNGALIAGADTGTIRIGRWDGSAWSQLGSSTDNFVVALTSYENALIAGGGFSTAFGRGSRYIAAWGPTTATTTTIHSTTPNPSLIGQPVTLTARVSGRVAPNPGTVTFIGAPSGSCSDLTLTVLNDTISEASCTVIFNNPGVQQITARYDGAALPGDFGHLPSTSSVYSHAVGGSAALPTATTITSVSSGSNAGLGQNYTVNVSVSASLSPVGTISVSDGYGARCGPVAVSGGVAACTMTSWQVGPKTLRAVFTPGTGFAASSDTEALLVTSPGNDWLYVSSPGNSSIRRARLDGSSTSVVSNLANGRAIAYDPMERRIYVGACTSGGQLVRSNLDGSSLTTIQSETGCIYGVALDPYARKVYWSNLSNGTIRRSNLDGSSTETIAIPGGGPAGITLDLEAGKIYWGEYSARRYRRANLDGSSIEAVLTRSTPVNFLYLDPPQDRSFLTEGLFGTDFFGRSTMSFSSVTGLGLSVVAPTGIAMDHITDRLYVANEGGGRVGAVNADGSAPVTTLFSGLASPIGLALIPAPDSSTSVVSTISPNPARIGEPVLVTVTVTGAVTRPANGLVTISANTGQSCNDATPEPGSGTSITYACSLVFDDVIGVVSLNATFSGSTTHTASTTTAALPVQQAATEMRIDGFNPSGSQLVNTAYEVYASVTGGTGPSGTIAVSDGSGGMCTITLPATHCELTSTLPGNKTITASYAGDSFHAPSSGIRSYFIRSAGTSLPGLQVGAVVLPATAAAPTVNATTQVSFSQAFREIPVVIVQTSDENAGPQGLRIRNVTATGFEVLQVEPPGCSGCDGSSGTKTVHWLAATPGRYRLEQDTLVPAWLGSALRGSGPGALLIVGQVSTTATQHNASVTGFSAWPAAAWESVSWPTVGGGLDFSTPPVVLTTIQSWANEGSNLTASGLVGASQPWAQSVQRNLSTGGFQLALDAGEVSADDLAPAGFAIPEVVGYVAMDANVSQALLPVGGPPTVGLVSGSVAAGVLCRTVDLDFPLGTAIDAANFRGFAGKQSRAIPDGGWLRRCQLTNPAGQTVRIGFRREEDQAFDSGDPALRSPIEDQAGTVAFSGNFTTTPVTLAELSVSRVGSELEVRWTTATEVAQLGYRLWGRARSGEWRLLTPELIGATAGERMSAASYSARVSAVGVDEVRLEDVDVLGHARFHPAVAVGESRGSAPTESAIDWSAIRTENAAVLAARAAAPTSATASVLARVNRDGVQRIAGSALIALDARFAGAPASSLAVLDGERPVWRHVGCTTLTADCTIEFVGQARESRYGAVRAYTITLDSAAVRMAAGDHVQAGSGSLRSYASEVRDYSNRLYNASINGPDPWFDARIAATSGAAEVSRSFTLPERVAGPVTLTVDLHGGLDFPDAAPDHHVLVQVNGQTLADRWFDGLRPERIEVAVPESLLAANNTLTIRVPRDTGYSADVVLLEGYSVRYTRQSRMDGTTLAQGRLDPTLAYASSGELLRDGFETVTPNPGFSGFALADAPTGTVLWSEVEGRLGRDVLPAGEVRVDTRSSRWLAAAPASVQSPTLALPAAPYSLPAELDYLAVAHPLFADGLQPLLQLQASRNLRTAVITTEAIYAAHSNHVPAPEAIRTAVQAAKARGARFLLLVGGDSYDYHDYLGIGSQSYVPTEYVAANDYLFHAATDAAYADVDGDQQPDLALGRLPVRTQAELTRVLTSIVARGNTLPQQYLAVAGRSDPGENFALHGRASLSVLRQPGQQKVFALADEIGTAAAREQARAGLAGSADWISYQGHSSPSRWAFDNLLDIGQLGSVQRSGLPAVVSQWSCWTNAFVLPTQDTMAHALMLRDNRLAASVIGATSLSEDASHLALAVRFFDLVEDGKLREAEQVTAGTIGEALQQAGRDLIRREPQHAPAVLNIALFGDPAAPIR